MYVMYMLHNMVIQIQLTETKPINNMNRLCMHKHLLNNHNLYCYWIFFSLELLSNPNLNYEYAITNFDFIVYVILTIHLMC